MGAGPLKRVRQKKAKTSAGGPSPRARQLCGAELDGLAIRVGEELERLHWDQKRLAAESGVSESVISRLAQGVRLWAIIAMAKALGVRVGYLAAGELPRFAEGSKVPRALAHVPHFEEPALAVSDSGLTSVDDDPRPRTRKSRV